VGRRAGLGEPGSRSERVGARLVLLHGEKTWDEALCCRGRRVGGGHRLKHLRQGKLGRGGAGYRGSVLQVYRAHGGSHGLLVCSRGGSTFFEGVSPRSCGKPRLGNLLGPFKGSGTNTCSARERGWAGQVRQGLACVTARWWGSPLRRYYSGNGSGPRCTRKIGGNRKGGSWAARGAR